MYPNAICLIAQHSAGRETHAQTHRVSCGRAPCPGRSPAGRWGAALGGCGSPHPWSATPGKPSAAPQRRDCAVGARRGMQGWFYKKKIIGETTSFGTYGFAIYCFQKWFFLIGKCLFGFFLMYKNCPKTDRIQFPLNMLAFSNVSVWKKEKERVEKQEKISQKVLGKSG